MFDHHCTACDKRQLIFPSQVTSLDQHRPRHRRRLHLLVRRRADAGHRRPREPPVRLAA